jgi:hypothetical protein
MVSLENQRTVGQAPPDLARLRQIFQKQWLLEQGDSTFVFPDSAYPFYKVPGIKDALIAANQGRKPPNIVMLLLESQRGVHCGYLKPYGASAAATPVMDALLVFWHSHHQCLVERTHVYSCPSLPPYLQ